MVPSNIMDWVVVLEHNTAALLQRNRLAKDAALKIVQGFQRARQVCLCIDVFLTQRLHGPGRCGQSEMIF